MKTKLKIWLYFEKHPNEGKKTAKAVTPAI